MNAFECLLKPMHVEDVYGLHGTRTSTVDCSVVYVGYELFVSVECGTTTFLNYSSNGHEFFSAFFLHIFNLIPQKDNVQSLSRYHVHMCFQVVQNKKKNSWQLYIGRCLF